MKPCALSRRHTPPDGGIPSSAAPGAAAAPLLLLGLAPGTLGRSLGWGRAGARAADPAVQARFADMDTERVAEDLAAILAG